MIAVSPPGPAPRLLRVRDLGRAVSYDTGMAEMRAAMASLEAEGPSLLLLEHAPTITVTRSGGRAHVRAPAATLAREGIALVEADRGGDVTFHGPGQLVGYPVVQLERVEGHLDLTGYIRRLETGLVSACAALGVVGCHTRPGMTGVWVGDGPDDEAAEKLVAIGVGVGRRGVTRHGFALNVTIDLDRYTARIVPCGLAGRGVTSLARLLKEPPAPDVARRVVAREVAYALGYVSDTPPLHEAPAAPAAHDGAPHG